MIEMRPIFDRVIITQAQPETKAGRFVLAGQEMQTDRGTVVAVGPGSLHPKTGERIPPPVKVGDRIAYDKGSGQALEQDGQHYLVLLPTNIIAIIDEPTEAVRAFSDAVTRLVGERVAA